MHTKSMAKNKNKMTHKKSDVEDVEIYRPICLLFACAVQTKNCDTDLIKSKQKIRQGSDAHFRQWSICRRTELLNKKSNERVVKMWVATIEFMRA